MIESSESHKITKKLEETKFPISATASTTQRGVVIENLDQYGSIDP